MRVSAKGAAGADDSPSHPNSALDCTHTTGRSPMPQTHRMCTGACIPSYMCHHVTCHLSYICHHVTDSLVYNFLCNFPDQQPIRVNVY